MINNNLSFFIFIIFIHHSHMFFNGSCGGHVIIRMNTEELRIRIELKFMMNWNRNIINIL